MDRTIFDYDRDMRTYSCCSLLCGVDEAGRGPLAGDVYAAAVIFGSGVQIDGLNDSKKLSEKKREALYDEIVAKADAYSVATASVEEIDAYNILNATFLAMRRAVAALHIAPEIILVDGNRLPDWEYPSQAVVGGDGKSASIAAASILAKVSRDRYMREMARQYPAYQFDKHKGYGTKLHCERILQYGPCEIHRRTFLRKLYGGNE